MSASGPIATHRSVTGIPTGRLAVWWVIASEIVIFGGLLACYLMLRLHYLNEWGDLASHTKTWAGTVNTLVLLTSSLFIVLAHYHAEKKNIAKARNLIFLTIFCGLIFMCVKAYEYTSEWSQGYTLTSNVFWSFYYTATAIHGIHVLAGMVIMGFVAHWISKGQHLGRVELIGIYWHFVDVVWIFLFPLLYIAK